MSKHSNHGRKRKPLGQLTLANDMQLASKKMRSSDDNETFKRAGSITRMVLKNFMCHSLLDVEFSTNISIMIGRNGSGKSAILTALVVGLGGRASATNRGNSIKSFIKAGQTSCTIEIELCNEGPMAYRPGAYGEKIIVVRHITANGSSTYRIKGHNGEVVATLAREVTNITTGLNIQVDNPICILNQDTSRNFLNSNDPRHKFQLFMRATKLETLESEYKKISQNRSDAVRKMDEKKTHMETIENEMKKLKKLVDHHNSIADIQDRVSQAHTELLWARVRDCEAEVAQDQAVAADAQKKYDKIMGDSSNKIEEIAKIKKKIEELQQQVCELKETIKVQSRPLNDARAAVEELRASYSRKRQEKRSITIAIENKTKDAAVIRTEMENINESLSRAEQAKAQRLKDLKDMEDKIKGMDDHLTTSRNDLYQIKSDLQKKEEEQQNLRREGNHIDSQISKEKDHLRSLTQQSGDALYVYGQQMPAVMRMIEQNKHRFSKMPKGPLGMHVKLKEKKWGIAVEGYLTPKMLGTFVVDNVKDSRLLLDIFQRTIGRGRKPQIITSQFVNKRHDVRARLVQAPPDCVSIYNAIEVDDPVVSNTIVDQMSIEDVLLIPSNERAMELLSNRNRVPHNCRIGLTIEGDRYFPDPNYKSYASTYKRARFLQVDSKELVQQMEHSIKRLTAHKREFEDQFSAISREIAEQNGKRNQLDQKIRKLHEAKNKIRAKFEQLKATAAPEVASAELLENELGEINNTLGIKNAALDRVVEELRDIKASIGDKEAKLEQLKDANSELQDRIQGLEVKIQKENDRKNEISTNDEFNKKRARQFEVRLEETRAAVVVKQNNLKHLLERAGEMGGRLETLRTIQDILHEINSLESSVKRIENDSQNFEAVHARYKLLSKKITDIRKVVAIIHTDLEELTRAIAKRKKHYKETEKYFICYIQDSFTTFMQCRQFQGSLEIDMNAKSLSMNVIPQQGSQGLTSTANLSGGERSFSTVGFLYSLWQCMEFPFYFLDEFDVYMDKQNRSKVTEILIHHAKTHPTLQFVFLTPQDVSFVDRSVTILRLAAPKRLHV